MRLFVFNLNFQTGPREVRDLFSPYGCTDAFIAIDHASGKSRGFAFVTVANHLGEKAIAELDGATLGGRVLRVSVALARPPRVAA